MNGYWLALWIVVTVVTGFVVLLSVSMIVSAVCKVKAGRDDPRFDEDAIAQARSQLKRQAPDQ